MADHRITVNGRHYDCPDAMPPDVRRTYEAAMRLMRSSPAPARGASGFHVSLDVERASGPSSDEAARPTLPVEPSDLEARIREIPMRIAIVLVVALFLLWAFLDR